MPYLLITWGGVKRLPWATWIRLAEALVEEVVIVFLAFLEALEEKGPTLFL